MYGKDVVKKKRTFILLPRMQTSIFGRAIWQCICKDINVNTIPMFAFLLSSFSFLFPSLFFSSLPRTVWAPCSWGCTMVTGSAGRCTQTRAAVGSHTKQWAGSCPETRASRSGSQGPGLSGESRGEQRQDASWWGRWLLQIMGVKIQTAEEKERTERSPSNGLKLELLGWM